MKRLSVVAQTWREDKKKHLMHSNPAKTEISPNPKPEYIHYQPDKPMNTYVKCQQGYEMSLN